MSKPKSNIAKMRVTNQPHRKATRKQPEKTWEQKVAESLARVDDILAEIDSPSYESLKKEASRALPLEMECHRLEQEIMAANAKLATADCVTKDAEKLLKLTQESNERLRSRNVDAETCIKELYNANMQLQEELQKVRAKFFGNESQRERFFFEVKAALKNLLPPCVLEQQPVQEADVYHVPSVATDDFRNCVDLYVAQYEDWTFVGTYDGYGSFVFMVYDKYSVTALKRVSCCVSEDE